MIRVELHESPMSIFKYDIDEVSFAVPDQFRPHVGDQLRFNLLRRRATTTQFLTGVVVFVVGAQWQMKLLDSGDYSATLVLTIASEMPAKTGTRRKHKDSP